MMLMTMETTMENTPIDARVIGLDETHLFTIDDEDAPHIKQILEVYLYDKNSHTHLCEVTPSYELIHLYTQVRLTDDALTTLTEDEVHDIYEKYEDHGCQEDKDVHCHDIDALEKPLTQLRRYHKDGVTTIAHDETREEIMEGLFEEFRANVVI